MNGPDNYREAERWLEHAKGAYLDISGNAGPREGYATEAEWMDALRESAEHYERALREAAVFAALGQAHATLALAAATANQTAVMAFAADINDRDVDAWYEAAGTKPQPKGGADRD